MKYVIPFLFLAIAAQGAVVRLAPEFTFPGPGNKAQTLHSLRGQPVVLVIANSSKSKALKKQLVWLRDLYQAFASRKAVFIAAYKNGAEPVQSNIPFALANNGAAVAAAYGVNGDFALVIIGKDGNIDYETVNPQTPQRIRDVMQNSFEIQAASRKTTPVGPITAPKPQE